MRIKQEPNQIYQEYEDGKSYNTQIDLYDNVEKNERFYIGNHWEGVNAPNMMKPVFNIVKRVVTYFLAMLVSDDIGVSISPFSDDDVTNAKAKIIAKEVEKIIERTKFKSKERTNVRNMCVDGDTAMFTTFDIDIETSQDYTGDIDNEIVENTNVIFGNPYSIDTQKQPYIIVVQRLYIDQVKDMAKNYGCSDDDIAKIQPDSDSYINSDDKLVTVLTKMWKQEGEEEKVVNGLLVKKKTKTVWYMKTTKDVVIKEPVDTECKLYPLAYATWERKKNSYHGQSPITGLIPNQIFINKLFAMAMVYVTNNGFPRVLFDSNKIGKLTNDVSKGIAVNNLDLLTKVIDSAQTPDFSNQVTSLIQLTADMTKECMGANDAALGNIKPDNTSAIIALQQASQVPLELQRLALFDFIEDNVRIIVDMMSNYYGIRKVKVSRDDLISLSGQKVDDLKSQVDELTGKSAYDMIPEESIIDFDFNDIKTMNYELNVDIGQSSYWAETTQISTMDNLFNKGILTDAVLYLESLPDKYVKNKNKIIDDIKQKQTEMEQQAQMQQQLQMQQPTEKELAQ